MAQQREPAPEPLELVRQFVNSYDYETASDNWSSTAALRDWFVEHDLIAPGIKVTAADLRRAQELREALRAMLWANNGQPLAPGTTEVLNEHATRAPLVARFDDGGHIGVGGRATGVDGALATILAVVLEAVADGSWTRLKACRDDECKWAYYDRSRNRSSAWCLMAVCGNRSKARAYRQRQG